MGKDYYKILGVDRKASVEEITKAYRKLAMQHHPDKNSDADAMAKIKEINQAFEVLSHPQKRESYDRFGDMGDRPAAAQYGRDFDPFSMFGDLFKDAFAEHNHRGVDIQTNVRVTLEEAFNGCDKIVDCSSHGPCNSCHGTGYAKYTECHLCNGTGQIHRRQGPMQVSFSCSRCRGTGKIPSVGCEQCSGSGKVSKEKEEHTIHIPAGVDNGIALVVRGKGEFSAAGIRGDIICNISVIPHELYERDGVNLFCTIPITYAQAVLGHEIELPTLNKQSCKVIIPPGVRSGGILRVRGMGMPIWNRNGMFGDLLAKIQVYSPDQPSEKYLQTVKLLAELDDKEVYEPFQAFNSRLKNLRNN